MNDQRFYQNITRGLTGRRSNDWAAILVFEGNLWVQEVWGTVDRGSRLRD